MSLKRAMVIVVVMALSVSGYAGQLEDFEKSGTDASTQDSTDSNRNDRRHGGDDDDDSDGAVVNMAAGLLNSLLGGPSKRNRHSFDSNENDSSQEHGSGRERDKNILPLLSLNGISSEHTPGGLCIPYFRADVNYQWVESDIQAIDYRVQLGSGLLAVDFNQTRYTEQDPDDELNIYRLMGLLRISSNEIYEVDLGLGSYTIDGQDSETGLAASVPILVVLHDNIAIEFRPVWTEIDGNEIKDYDLSVILNSDYIALRGGYRWLETETESLNGPFAGVSIRY